MSEPGNNEFQSQPDTNSSEKRGFFSRFKRNNSPISTPLSVPAEAQQRAEQLEKARTRAKQVFQNAETFSNQVEQAVSSRLDQAPQIKETKEQREARTNFELASLPDEEIERELQKLKEKSRTQKG